MPRTATGKTPGAQAVELLGFLGWRIHESGSSSCGCKAEDCAQGNFVCAAAIAALIVVEGSEA